jgi:hypothetical protein
MLRIAAYMPISKGGGGDPFRDPNDNIAPQRLILQIVDQPASLNPNQWPQRGGAKNTGYFPGDVSFIRINPLSPSGGPISDDFARFAFVAEMAEVIMGFYGWGASTGHGEALSRIFAELLYPASAYDTASSSSPAPWVNNWLNTVPRTDFISVNEPTDRDQISYGCGILFINYLCYQLNVPLEAVCQAGGVTLKDHYKNLTGNTDDPLAAMNNLLNAHYPASDSINLLNNNPFPLLDAANRKVSLAFQKSASAHPVPLSGIAHVAPFFTCPAKDYAYTGVGVSVQWAVTATAIGFGRPRFTWRVNGSSVPSTGGTLSVTADVDIPNPNDPTRPAPSSGVSLFDYTDNDVNTRDTLGNVLALWNDAHQGDYHVKIEVDVTELADPIGAPAIGSAPLDFDALYFRYDAQYYIDGQACEEAFEKAITHLPKLEQLINILHTLPDPPEGPRVAEVVDAIDQIRAEVSRAAGANEEQGEQLAEYIAGKLRVAPELILPNARISPA